MTEKGRKWPESLMNLDHIRTFLEIADCGNFNRAAENLNVTQSTASGRIKAIEERFGASLFHRSHAGAELTPEGRRFQRYALSLQRLWQQAHQAVTLPPGYRDIFSLAGQVSLWDRLILPWVPWMREKAPDIALRVEADYSTSQMRQLSDGLIDLGVMYTSRQVPGLVTEKLLEEKLVLVATEPRTMLSGWVEDYVYVDWGDNMRRLHAEHFQEMGTPAVSVGLGPLGLE